MFSFIFSNLKNCLCPVLLTSGYWKTATMEEITVVILVDAGEPVSITWHSHYLMQSLAPRRSSIHFAKLNYVKQLIGKLTWNTSIIWITISQVSGKHTYSRYVTLSAKKLGSPARALARTHTHTHILLYFHAKKMSSSSPCCNDINQMKTFLFHFAFRIAVI